MKLNYCSMRGFPYWGDGAGMPPLAQMLFFPLHQEKSYPPNFYPPTK